MPQYVILAEHPPDVCPSSNARSRARAVEGMGQDLPRLSTEAGVAFVTGPLHLDPGHRTIAIVDAPSVEVVAQLVYATGLSQWNTVEVCPTRARGRPDGRPRQLPDRLRVGKAVRPRSAKSRRRSGDLLVRAAISTLPDTLRTLSSTRGVARALVARARRRSGCRSAPMPDSVSTSTWSSTPLATPTETSPETERTCSVPSPRARTRTLARHVAHPGAVRQLAQADVTRAPLDLDPAAGRTNLEVARRRGEHRGPSHARAAQVTRRRMGPDLATDIAQRDVAAGRLRRHVGGHVVGRDVPAADFTSAAPTGPDRSRCQPRPWRRSRRCLLASRRGRSRRSRRMNRLPRPLRHLDHDDMTAARRPAFDDGVLDELLAARRIRLDRHGRRSVSRASRRRPDPTSFSTNRRTRPVSRMSSPCPMLPSCRCRNRAGGSPPARCGLSSVARTCPRSSVRTMKVFTESPWRAAPSSTRALRPSLRRRRDAGRQVSPPRPSTPSPASSPRSAAHARPPHRPDRRRRRRPGCRHAPRGARPSVRRRPRTADRGRARARNGRAGRPCARPPRPPCRHPSSPDGDHVGTQPVDHQ